MLKRLTTSWKYDKLWFIFYKRHLGEIDLGTAWKAFKYGGFSRPYFPVFNPNTGKCGSEKPPYLDSFHTVRKYKVHNNISMI